MSLNAIILCAGKSVRMGGERQKALLPILGTPLVRHVAVAVCAANPSAMTAVVGFAADSVAKCLRAVPFAAGIKFVRQKNQLGTGHALREAFNSNPRKSGDVLVINGDMPAVTGSLIKKIVSSHKKNRAAVSFATALTENPSGCGRVVRGANGQVEKIVEHADASAGEKKIREVNAGIYCFRNSFLPAALAGLKKKNTKGEYYITDLVEAALRKGEKALAFTCADSAEVAGVNTPAELCAAEARMMERTNARILRAGAVISDPSTCRICPETKIGAGTLISPFTFINRSTIGAGCVIGAGVFIKESTVAPGCRVEFSSMLDGCVMRAGASAGPFARLRPGSVMMENSRAGSFVEIKKSSVGKNSKVPHLSYIGDCELGSGVNIGAGSITCNYDGEFKHRTEIADDVFIGADTMLVAPVKVGAGAATAAGSVITRDVPPRSLAIGRSRQREVARRRSKKKAGKG